MPHAPENVDRRRGAILALRELLRQGLDVEASCQVQDWPSFLSQAFDSLLAKEIVDLLPWDNLAVMRKNKKTIESQNLRAVIDSNCFYRVFKAHIAIGFSSKQKELVIAFSDCRHFFFGYCLADIFLYSCYSTYFINTVFLPYIPKQWLSELHLDTSCLY